MTTRTIADRLDITPELVRVALRRLRRDGKVTRVLSTDGDSVWQRSSGS